MRVHQAGEAVYLSHTCHDCRICAALIANSEFAVACELTDDVMCAVARQLAALYLSFLCSALVLGAGTISQHSAGQLCGIRRVQTCSTRSTGLSPAHC